ncbi:unnamed protein product [Closterium sp. Yama58-4]|nr:unnamed protein product [Closterium sp. Yama58-4]
MAARATLFPSAVQSASAYRRRALLSTSRGISTGGRTRISTGVAREGGGDAASAVKSGAMEFPVFCVQWAVLLGAPDSLHIFMPHYVLNALTGRVGTLMHVDKVKRFSDGRMLIDSTAITTVRVNHLLQTIPYCQAQVQEQQDQEALLLHAFVGGLEWTEEEEGEERERGEEGEERGEGVDGGVGGHVLPGERVVLQGQGLPGVLLTKGQGADSVGGVDGMGRVLHRGPPNSINRRALQRLSLRLQRGEARLWALLQQTRDLSSRLRMDEGRAGREGKTGHAGKSGEGAKEVGAMRREEPLVLVRRVQQLSFAAAAAVPGGVERSEGRQQLLEANSITQRIGILTALFLRSRSELLARVAIKRSFSD